MPPSRLSMRHTQLCGHSWSSKCWIEAACNAPKQQRHTKKATSQASDRWVRTSEGRPWLLLGAAAHGTSTSPCSQCHRRLSWLAHSRLRETSRPAVLQAAASLWQRDHLPVHSCVAECDYAAAREHWKYRGPVVWSAASERCAGAREAGRTEDLGSSSQRSACGLRACIMRKSSSQQQHRFF